MKPKIGLWIDQKKAVIVSVSDKGEDMNTLESKIENCCHASGKNCSCDNFGRKDFPAHDLTEREMDKRFQKYYDEVISLISNADSLLIFGPGFAKEKLSKRIEANTVMTRNVKLETADKMTDNEIFQKVRHHFLSKGIDGLASGRFI